VLQAGNQSLTRKLLISNVLLSMGESSVGHCVPPNWAWDILSHQSWAGNSERQGKFWKVFLVKRLIASVDGPESPAKDMTPMRCCKRPVACRACTKHQTGTGSIASCGRWQGVGGKDSSANAASLHHVTAQLHKTATIVSVGWLNRSVIAYRRLSRSPQVGAFWASPPLAFACIHALAGARFRR
jgi:hypothetical protein